MTTSGDALAKLIEGRRLTPSQRRIAHRLMTHRSDVAFLSSSELAALADVSQPSVSRFVRTLGFGGFAEFSQFLRESAGMPDALARERTDDDGNLYQRAVSAEIANLQRLRSDLADPRELRDIASRLVDSGPVAVIGLRASSGLAHTFGYFAAIVLPDVRVFTHFDSVTQDALEQARRAGATWAVVLALPRYPTEIVAVARFARSIGLHVLAITDSLYSSLTDVADATLIAPVGNQLVFDSHVVPTMLCMALLEAITEVSPDATQQRLEAFEESVATRRVFDGP